jgi:hypothetical protein
MVLIMLLVLPLSVPAPAASAATSSEASKDEFSERRAGDASVTFDALAIPPKLVLALADDGARGNDADDADESDDEGAVEGAERWCE